MPILGLVAHNKANKVHSLCSSDTLPRAVYFRRQVNLEEATYEYFLQDKVMVTTTGTNR